MNKVIMAASNISLSELKSNRKYFSLSMRMFSTRPNRNSHAVTEAFIDDIIANKNDYVCMPLCADVPKLKRKDYKGLTHLYDKTTGQFLADMIGGFYDFEKVEDEFGISLIGYARINKRSPVVCEAIQELYDSNALNFSFEITAGAVSIIDGVTIVDVNESNELTAMAIVSVPAYPESKALDLVAEANIDQFYANANMLISEVDIETVRMRFHEALYHTIGDLVFNLNVMMFCHDCVILYDYMNGVIYKAEYIMDNDCIVIKDFYEVGFVRSEGSEKDMELNENMISEQTTAEEVVSEENMEITAEENTTEEVIAEETVIAETEEVVAESTEEIQAEAEVAAENEVVAEVEEKENDPEDIEDDKKDEDDQKENDEFEAMKKRCAELEAENAELNKVKAEFDKITEEKKAAELQAEKDAMKAYASKQGLNTENSVIAEAIENLDYKTIVAEVMNKTTNSKQETSTTYLASFTEIKPSGYSYLLERN